MALFKISQGKEENLPQNLTEGYAYYTQDTNNFYIDIKKDGQLKRTLSGAGQKTIDHSEIFNDYERNTNYGSYNHIEGYNNLVGRKVFRIISVNTNENSITLDSNINGLSEGDIISYNVYNQNKNYWTTLFDCNTIIDIDYTNNIITLEKTLSGLQNLSSSFIAQNNIALWVNEKPEVGSTTSSIAIHTEGAHNQGLGNISHVEGGFNKAIGVYSHAEGGGTIAGNEAAHAEGGGSIASGGRSHAEGDGTIAQAWASHSEGQHTIATKTGQHVEGIANIKDTEKKYLHILGNGTVIEEDDGSLTITRSNAHTIDKDGNTFFSGSLNSGNNNKAYGPYTSAIGENTQAGITGYYFVHIDNENPQMPVFYLSTKQYNRDINPTTESYEKPTGNIPYEAGDIISYVSGAKYVNIGSIVDDGVDNINKTIRVGLNNEVKIGAYDDGVDDQIFYVATKPDVGPCRFGHYAHAEGDRTQAIERSSHAEGRQTIARGQYSHTEGRSTEAMYAAHAEGSGSKAMGEASHAEGASSIASGDRCHAEGNSSKAQAWASHAEGEQTIASAAGSHSEGSHTTASGSASHSEGSYTQAKGSYSHAEGYETEAYGNYSHTEGKSTKASYAAHTEGEGTEAGYYSHAEGLNTYAYHTAHAEGENSRAEGHRSHAEGYGAKATGIGSHAEGKATAAGDYSHAENQAIANGNYSHAEGNSSSAIGSGSHAEGYNTQSQGTYSHAEGAYAVAQSIASHAGGIGTYTFSPGQTVIGRCNRTDIDSSNYAQIVGNGEYNPDTLKPTSRDNAYTLDWDGNGWFAGTVTIGSSKQELATKAYVDQAIQNAFANIANGEEIAW